MPFRKRLKDFKKNKKEVQEFQEKMRCRLQEENSTQGEMYSYDKMRYLHTGIQKE